MLLKPPEFPHSTHGRPKSLPTNGPQTSPLTTEPPPGAFETAILGWYYGVPGVLKRALYDLVRTAGFGIGLAVDEEGRECVAEEMRKLVRTPEKLKEMWSESLSLESNSFTCSGSPISTGKGSMCTVSSTQG